MVLDRLVNSDKFRETAACPKKACRRSRDIENITPVKMVRWPSGADEKSW